MANKIWELIQTPFYQNKALIKGGFDQIARNNLSTVYQSSILGWITTFLLCLVTPLLIPEWFVSVGHLLIILTYGAFMVLAKHLLKARKIRGRWMQFVSDAYVVVSLVLIAYINTIPYPDKPGTLMASMMILSAALFTYSIYEALAIFSGVLILFVHLVFTFKADIVIGEDLFMVVSGYFLSGVVFLLVNKLRYKEFVLKNHYIKLSCYDDLTGVLAKMPCEDACQEYLENRAGKSCALVIIDVDNFKNINDKYGHYQGDLVLKTVGEQLKTVFLDTDILGRIGGDEFLVLLKDIEDPQVVEKKLGHFVQVVEAVVAAASNIPVSLSLGGVLIDEKPVEFATIYQLADKIMYQNKQADHQGFIKNIEKLQRQTQKQGKGIFLSWHQETCNLVNGILDYEFKCVNRNFWSQPRDLLDQKHEHIHALVLDYNHFNGDQDHLIKLLKENQTTINLPVLLINAKGKIDPNLQEYVVHQISYPLTKEKLTRFILADKFSTDSLT